jgi:signal transduction histidine kinase
MEQQTPDSQSLARLGRHLAHELNNPISAISSAAYLIDDFAKSGEEGKVEAELIQPFVDSIREECMKMKGVIEEFTRFVTTESILPMPAEISEFLDSRVRENQSDGMSVVLTKPSGNLPKLNADIGQLQFAFTSIVAEAKAAGATEVRVTFTCDEQNCVFEFRDNRPGTIEKEEVDQMLSPVPSKKGKGLGLKLPTVKKIVGLHGGRMSVEALSPAGLLVRLEIPTVQPSTNGSSNGTAASSESREAVAMH